MTITDIELKLDAMEKRYGSRIPISEVEYLLELQLQMISEMWKISDEHKEGGRDHEGTYLP